MTHCHSANGGLGDIFSASGQTGELDLTKVREQGREVPEASTLVMEIIGLRCV